MIPNEFTRRYAIRLPDGSLYTGHNQLSYERACQAYSDFMAMPSARRDMAQMSAGIFGVGATPTEPPKPPAASSGDPARDFAEQITAWLHEQGGAQ